MKSENFTDLKIFEFLIKTLLFKSSKSLNISDQLLLLQILIRLSLFNSISTSDLTQTDNIEVSNFHKINLISHLIRIMIKIKISAVIEIMIEIMIKTEIKRETEIKIMIMIMKTEAEVKIIIKDSNFIIISV